MRPLALDLKTPPVSSSTRGSGLAALLIPPDEEGLTFVEPLELAALLATPGAAIVVDVRSEEERTDGYIAGSVHMPSELWNPWQFEPGASPVHTGLDSAALGLIAEAASAGTQLVFHCMYSSKLTSNRPVALWCMGLS